MRRQTPEVSSHSRNQSVRNNNRDQQNPVYLSGQPAGQFPTFSANSLQNPAQTNYRNSTQAPRSQYNVHWGQNQDNSQYVAPRASNLYSQDAGAAQSAMSQNLRDYRGQSSRVAANTWQPAMGLQNTIPQNSPDPDAAAYQLPRPISSSRLQAPQQPLQQGAQGIDLNIPTMLGGLPQYAAGNLGPQNAEMIRAWEKLASAQITNADSQLQYAAAKAHPKFIKFRGGKEGLDIETYILRNEQMFTQSASDAQKVARLAQNLSDFPGVADLLGSGWRGDYQSFKDFLLLTYRGARRQTGVATWASVRRYQNEDLQTWQVKWVELVSLTWSGWSTYTDSERELIMRQMETIVPSAALAVYKDANGEFDAQILSTKTFQEILKQLRVHQDNMGIIWKPFNDKLPKQNSNSENRVHNVNETSRDSQNSSSDNNSPPANSSNRRGNRGNRGNSNMWCKHHRSTNHSTRECRNPPRQQNAANNQGGSNNNNNTSMYCRYHKNTSHNTADCRNPNYSNNNNRNQGYNQNQSQDRTQYNNRGNSRGRGYGHNRGNSRGRGNNYGRGGYNNYNNYNRGNYSNNRGNRNGVNNVGSDRGQYGYDNFNNSQQNTASSQQQTTQNRQNLENAAPTTQGLGLVQQSDQ